jgi:hypothetical protein
MDGAEIIEGGVLELSMAQYQQDLAPELANLVLWTEHFSPLLFSWARGK